MDDHNTPQTSEKSQQRPKPESISASAGGSVHQPGNRAAYLDDLSQMFDSAPVGMCLVDTDLRFVRINEHLAKINGLPVQAHIGKTLAEVIPKVAPVVEPFYRKVIATGLPLLEIDIQGRTRTETDHDLNYLVSYYPVKDKTGCVRGVNTVVQDITTRKQAEIALRESERTLTTLLSNLPGMAYRCHNDPAWTMEFVSEGCYELTGYQPEELVGNRRMAYAHLIHPDDQDSVWQSVQDAVTKKCPFRLVYRICPATGPAKWVWEQGVGIFSNNGELLSLEGFITDITDRKLAETALQQAHVEQEKRIVQRTAALKATNAKLLEEMAVREQAEQMLRRTQFAVDRASEAIFWVQSDGRIFDANEAACQSLQYTAEELCRLRVWQIDPDFPESMWYKEWRSFRDQVSVTLETRHQRRDGVIFPVEISANYLEFAQKEFMCVFVRDISERVRAQRTLRESEEKLQAILDNTLAVIYLKEVNGKYLLINRRYEELFGISRDKVVGKTDYDIFSKETADALAANDKLVIDANAPMEVEESVPHADGIHSYLSLKFPLFDAAGKLYAICGISADITSRKQSAEALQQAKDLAEEANRAKSIFLANMSHEIRTPITALLAAAQLLPECAEDEALHDQRIDVILRNGHHLLALIDGLLEQSRIEAGTVTIAKRMCSLAELLMDIQAVAMPIRKQPGVSFEVRCATRVPEKVFTDPTRFKQAIVNLCNNALKHTKAGYVRVTVGATVEQHRVILTVEVADSGAGIEPAELERIFERFVRTDDGVARGAHGVGLGLSIVQWIANQLGGQVSVRSDFGAGSVFTFQLDVGSVDEVDWLEPDRVFRDHISSYVSPLADQAESTLHGLVLLADDYEDSRTLIAAALSQAGATVITAADGQEALDETSSHSFDLILMDIRMPRLDGIAATVELRRRGCLVPIVALTASTLGDRQDGLFEAGFDDYWLKPMPIATLLSAVEAFLPSEERQPENVAKYTRSSGKHRGGTTKDRLSQLRQAYAATVGDKVQAIVQAIDAEEFDLAQSQLHQLVGSAGLHGMDKLSQYAATLLGQLRSDPPAASSTLIENLTREARRAVDAGD